MKGKTRIIFEYLSAFVVISLLLLAIGGVVVVKFYGDELKDFVVEQVNMRLDSTIDVEEVSVRVFHKFPNTSILLEGITIWSNHDFDSRYFDGQGADTLLTAETLSISFSMFGLVRKKFDVRMLELKNGVFHLYTDQSGNRNYVMVSNENKKTRKDQLLNLSNLRIDNFQIVINNQVKQIKSESTLHRLDLNGRLSKRNTQIKGNLTGFVKEISNKGIRYASDRNIEAKLNLNVQDSLFTIRSGQLRIDRIIADMDGRIQVHPGKGVELDLYADARNLEIYEVLDLLPSEMSNPLQEIHGNGIMQLYTRVTGMVNSTLTPKVEADFQTSNANLKWDRFPFSVKNLNLSGSYSNGGEFNPVTTSLNIESLSAVIGKDHISGRGRIHNFYDPDFSFDLKGEIHPEQWLDWYKNIPLHSISGTLETDLNVKGSYDRLKPEGEKFVKLDLSGNMAIHQSEVTIRKGDLPFSNLNGSISIDNDFWEPTISGNCGKTDFDISGSGLNLISFLLGEDKTLVASASLHSNHMDLQEILSHFSRAKKKSERSVFLPKNLDFRLILKIDDFIKDKFKASDVRGIATYATPSLFIDSLSMKTMEGSLKGVFGLVQDKHGTLSATANTTLNGLDIQQLFFAFNNFGQKQVTSDHLKGTVSGTSAFSAEFDTTLAIRPHSILSENSLTIIRGELNEFEPIMALSRFVEVEELRNIKFKTLNNTILIKDLQVIIPAMDIQSNALDLSASGIHRFDNTYDYRLKLKLSDILYNKTREAKRQEFEVATDKSDTRTIFLKVYKEGSEAIVEMDREMTAQKIRNDLKEEKIELKQILNKELGLFKKDEEVIDQKEEKESQEVFKFDFSEDPDSLAAPQKGKEKKRWWKKPLKKDTAENKPATKFVIDE
jgi:hypothetical protein